MSRISVCILLALACCLAGAPPPLMGAEEVGIVKMKRKPGTGDESIPPSIFPHGIHRVAFKCMACHDALFPMKAGATEVSMDMIQEGKACGACHNDTSKVAFPSSLATCMRCHK